jgi:NAD(P)-dependent dehydrogenase (short-subunit alcohol dehydrogenase family)
VIGVSRLGTGSRRVDLVDAAATAELFADLDRSVEPLAGVIHNAMQFHRQDFLSTRPEDFEAVWRSMAMTAFNVAQQAIPRLRTRGGGTLIFSGASGSLRAGSSFSAFSSAKFALRGLVQALAREHGAEGVHVVHAVIDGLIGSDKTRVRFSAAEQHRSIAADDLAEVYLQLMQQPRSAWTHELDIRPPGGSF